MVLAQIVKRRQFEQGRAQGREEVREEAREEALRERAEEREAWMEAWTQDLEAWAKENDIPIENLPKLRKPKSKRD